MYDDRTTRPPLMEAARERVAGLHAEDTPAPRRPGPIAGPTRAPWWIVPGLVLGTAAALYFLFAGAQSAPAPVEPAPTSPWVAPTALPGVPTEPWFAPGAEPTAVPTEVPVAPTVPVEEPAPAYVPQAAPVPVYAPPVPTADIFANPSDPQGEQMTAQALTAPGWHPPLVEGQAAPTPDNFVEPRP